MFVPPAHPFDSLRVLQVVAATALAAALGWGPLSR